MKNKLPFVLFVLSAIIFSCSKDNGPRPVAKKFLDAMQAHDYKTAGEYGTKETIKLLEQFEKIEQLNGKDVQEESGKITILSEDIQGKTATVYFQEEGNSLEQKITLNKVVIDGNPEWKVALKITPPSEHGGK